MYRKEINRISEPLWEYTPGDMAWIKESNISRCELLWVVGLGDLDGRLWIASHEPGGMSLQVSLKLLPQERLETMIHELFHIPYLDEGLPRPKYLGEESYNYLENTIEILSREFVIKYREWTEEMFHLWFGIKVTDFVVQ